MSKSQLLLNQPISTVSYKFVKLLTCFGFGWMVLLSAFYWVPPAAAQTMSETEFWDLLIETRNGFLIDDERPFLANQLKAIESVERADGTLVKIDTSYLVQVLEDPDIDSIDAGEIINAYIGLENEIDWRVLADPQLSLDDVLARSEFDYTPEPETFLQRVWRQVQEWFFGLLQSATGSTGGLWMVVLILLLGSLFAFWLSGVRRQFSAETELEFASEEDLNLSADGALARSQEFSRDGDYRNAVRYLYLSLLLLLDERDVLRYDRSKTNREYLRTVRSRPDLADLLASVIDVFDRVWYGFQPIGSAEYEQYAAQVDALRKSKPKEVAS